MEQEFLQYGVGGLALGVVVYVVKLFLGHIKDSDAAVKAFLGNHMSSNTKALQDLTAATERLADRVERVEDAMAGVRPAPRPRKVGSARA